MKLLRDKYHALLKEVAKLNEKGVQIRTIGEVELLPADVREPAAELEYKTRKNTTYTLNICVAYTSRLELVNASKKLLQATSDKSSLTVEDIDESLINRSLYLTSPPQLLIRTSGEVRLSDFLLFQVKKTLRSKIMVFSVLPKIRIRYKKLLIPYTDKKILYPDKVA